jgi:hypothetical protein
MGTFTASEDDREHRRKTRQILVAELKGKRPMRYIRHTCENRKI